MIKLLISLVILTSLAGCGSESKIKPKVLPKTTAEAYGDGNLTIIPVFFPISDESMSYDSPVANIGFLVGGLAKIFMDFGARMGLGKVQQVSLTQPIPEIPTDVLKEVRLKRVFFYIEPKKGAKRDKSWWEKLVNGRDEVSFKFLEKIAVKLSSKNIESRKSWQPEVETKNLDDEYSPLKSFFDDEPFKRQLKVKDTEALLLRYSSRDSEKYLRKSKIEKIYIINTTHTQRTRAFLTKLPELQGHFERVHILGKDRTIMVELVKDPSIVESFNSVLTDYKSELEDLGVVHVEACQKRTCLDLELPDVNLLPILARENGIKLDAFIQAKKVPESFSLKGFMEIETKSKLSF